MAAVNQIGRPGQEFSYLVDDPQVRPFAEQDIDDFTDTISEVHDKAVTKNELRLGAVVLIAAAIALFVLSHGALGIAVGATLALMAIYAANKSRNITPIVRDAQKYAYQAVFTGTRPAPSERNQNGQSGWLAQLLGLQLQPQAAPLPRRHYGHSPQPNAGQANAGQANVAQLRRY